MNRLKNEKDSGSWYRSLFSVNILIDFGSYIAFRIGDNFSILGAR